MADLASKVMGLKPCWPDIAHAQQLQAAPQSHVLLCRQWQTMLS